LALVTNWPESSEHSLLRRKATRAHSKSSTWNTAIWFESATSKLRSNIGLRFWLVKLVVVSRQWRCQSSVQLGRSAEVRFKRRRQEHKRLELRPGLVQQAALFLEERRVLGLPKQQPSAESPKTQRLEQASAQLWAVSSPGQFRLRGAI
jgi:hypothetical protein